MCLSNRGVSRIFVVTPTGGATNELVDLQTSNSIGDTLQGQAIQKAFFTSVDGAKIESQGAFVVDALGNVVGSVSASDPAKSSIVQLLCNPCESKLQSSIPDKCMKVIR